MSMATQWAPVSAMAFSAWRRIASFGSQIVAEPTLTPIRSRSAAGAGAALVVFLSATTLPLTTVQPANRAAAATRAVMTMERFHEGRCTDSPFHGGGGPFGGGVRPPPELREPEESAETVQIWSFV